MPSFDSHGPAVLPLTRRQLVGVAGSAGLGLVAQPLRAAPAAPVRDPAARLSAELDRLARDDDLSGTVRLARGNRVLLERAFGFADRGSRLPNRPDTRINIASIGKLFTSLAVLRLVAAGRLRLDQPLAEAWPGYPNAAAGQATIAQLLSHTAGFGNHHTWLGSYTGPPLLTNADYFRKFSGEPLAQPPGQGFAYSNNGYAVLALLVERIAGEPFFAHLERTIFAPLGMRDTAALRADLDEPRMARGYVRAPDRPGRWQDNFDPRTPVGTGFGGLYSTAADLDRFGAAMADGSLLPALLMAAWTIGRNPYHRGVYGLGCSEVTIGGDRIIGHSGGHPGWAGELMVWPASGWRLSLLTNCEPDAYFAIVSFAKQLFSGADSISRNHDFTRHLAATFLTGGAGAARQLLAAVPPGVRPGEGLMDMVALREIHRGRPAGALAMLRFNLELFPQSTGPAWSLAEALRHSGDRPGALTAYRAYLAREPDDADANRWIAELEQA